EELPAVAGNDFAAARQMRPPGAEPGERPRRAERHGAATARVSPVVTFLELPREVFREVFASNHFPAIVYGDRFGEEVFGPIREVLTRLSANHLGGVTPWGKSGRRPTLSHAG